MSDINSQNQINVIHSLKEQSEGTKASLEQLNKVLQELHKNILKESSKNLIKSLQQNEKEENGKNKDNLEDEKNEIKENIKEDKKENNSEEMKEDKKLENKEEQDKKSSSINIENSGIDDINDKISNNNINKIKNSQIYKTTNDINVINSIGIKKKETNTIKENDENQEKSENLEKNDKNINNNIIKNINNNINNEDIKKETQNSKIKEDNIININNNKNKQYVYKEMDELTESNIVQDELILYNISQGSELYLNEVIDKLGGFEENNLIKEEGLNNTTKINENFINEIDSDSVKIDSKEDLKLALTNIPLSDEKDNTSQITNELNKACIRTNDNIKSKDLMSNIDLEIPKEDEKDDMGKVNKNLSKKNTKNSTNNNNINNNNNNNNINININTEKKTGIEILFNNEEQKKDEKLLNEEKKREIYNEINNMYESKLNLVKINNKEKFSYITKFNDPDKEKFGYESDYFYRSKNSINFVNRRNNFLQGKYFSYILSKKKNNVKKEKEKEKENEKNAKNKNKNKDKKKDDSIDSYDNYEFKEEDIKFKKNYNEKIEPIQFNLNFIRANTQHDDLKEHKIYDVEDMTSFYYYFNFYNPEEDFKKVLDEEAENEIVKNFTTYRKVLNDGNSFARAFSYLLLETFILQNKVKKLEFIIYDIKRMLGKKFKDIKDVCNILIDIKENSSIDYLMNSYNSLTSNFDEVMITYIEDTIKNALGVENSKRKYQEMDFEILRLLVNIFDINLEIYYIEESNDNNKLLTMEKTVVLNNTFMQTKKNIQASSYSECESSTTIRLLFFLNSFYIVYTHSSDIDSTLANNNIEKQYYYVSSLPKYKCPTCKKCTGLDILPSYEAIFCHVCLTKYLQVILEKRAILFVKSNFSCIEYYTRPIKITSDIIITFSLYKYITKNYITYDFGKIIERICFKCFEIFEKDNINTLKCLCQLCDNCLDKLLRENTKDKIYLNSYELNTLERTKCLCQNEVDLKNLMELSKNKPTKKDKQKAEERLIKVLKKRCCLCKEDDQLKIYKLDIKDGPPHYICLDCSDKLNKDENLQNSDKNKNEINNDFLSDHESNDTAIKDKDKDKKVTKKKFYCQICYDYHVFEDNNTGKVNNKVPHYGGKFKCCKGKCNIF